MILGKKKFIGVAVAVVFTIAGLGLLYLYSQPLMEHDCTFNSTEVAVAKVALEKGELLKREDLEVREVPYQFLPSNPLLYSDLPIYVGQPLEVAVDEGAIVLTSDFIPPTREFDLDDLSIAEHTLKIDGDAIHSMAAGIGPQDYIDIIITLTDEELPRSVMLLQRVQVVDAKDDGSSRSIILAVTADEAEILATLQTEAKLNILAREGDDEDDSRIESVGLQEVLEEMDVLSRLRFERQIGVAEANELAMEIPVSSIHSLPSDLDAGSRIDLLSVVDLEKLDMEDDDVQFVSLTLLQNVLVLAADESITVSVTHDEAHLLSMMQVAATFHILTRHPQDLDIVPITRQTIKGALKDLEVLQEMRGERKERYEQARRQHERDCEPGLIHDVRQHNDCARFRYRDLAR